jgi:hypothetical protein
MPRRPSDRSASPVYEHWLTLLPLCVAIVAAATIVIGS